METLQQLIQAEEGRAVEIVQTMRATLAAEEEDRRQKERELVDLKQQKLDAVGWQEKRDIDELIESHKQRSAMRHYQDSSMLGQPYFGVLELSDDNLGELCYLLGKQSFFDSRNRALVIDWRDAPISRLYYEYGASEFYEEEIRGKERSGTVKAKRQVDILRQELRKIVERDLTLVRNGNGWHQGNEHGGVIFRKEEKGDHRLPEITALISPDQFRAIASPESSLVLLQGGAGSGKTTVGLHRISFLSFQDPERFRPERMMVVVFNRSLRQYISKALPDLGVNKVQVETYHSWAGKIFRASGVGVSYSSEQISAPMARMKKSSVMLKLIDGYLERLLEKCRTWLVDQLGQCKEVDLEGIAKQFRFITRFEDFYRGLANRSGIFATLPGKVADRLFPRLLQRWNDHETDLRAMLSDRELLEGLDVKPDLLDQLAKWQTQLKESGKLDFTDTGILLALLQKKGVSAACPRYPHLMVDEAQDFSEIELATLIAAADEHQSVTICGDMAQKIKGEFDFADSQGFAGFVKAQKVSMGAGNLRADSLAVGYRATRPVMELAWHVLQERPAMKVHRDGEPVQIVRTQKYEQALERSKEILTAYMKARPNALVAVICKYKGDTDRVFEDLKALGVEKLRRHSRDDFVFTPGVIVTNSSQVKGLEFSAVLVFNPSAGQYRDDRENRMLMHVVLTRAADHLWIVGHQPMAYGLENWEGTGYAESRGS